MHFIYVKVPSPRRADRSFDQLHRSLQPALASSGIGALVGWGASLPSPRSLADHPNGFHRLDIELQDLDNSLNALMDLLSGLQVSTGTEVHYTLGGAALQRSLEGAGWSEPVPSSGTHRKRAN